MLDVLAALGFGLLGAFVGAVAIAALIFRGLRRHVDAGYITIDSVRYAINPSDGDQRSNAVLQVKQALASGMLDAEVWGAVRRNQQRVGQ